MYTIMDQIEKEDAPEIKVYTWWIVEDVRQLCIKHDWYTRGTCKEYDAMLNYVGLNNPDSYHIYRVARDIYLHTERSIYLTVEDIMWDLERTCIKRSYEVRDNIDSMD